MDEGRNMRPIMGAKGWVLTGWMVTLVVANWTYGMWRLVGADDVLPPSAAAAAKAENADDGMVPVTSQNWEMDLKEGVYHYWGDVVVDAPGLMRLTCEDLVAVLPEGGGRMDRLVARTNVVIDIVRAASRAGDPPMKIRATGTMAVYTATNAVVTLTGNPRMVSSYGVASGDAIVYETETGRVRVLGNVDSRLNLPAFRTGGKIGSKTNSIPTTPRPTD